MNIRQLQNEKLVNDLLAKYQPIIDTIMTLSEGIDVMSEDMRLRWIKSHTLKLDRSYFFVEEFINGTTDMGETVLGLDADSLGRALSKIYSVNDIIYACTYFEFLNNRNRGDKDYSHDGSLTIYTYGNPPILKEERKMSVEEIGKNNFEKSDDDFAIIGGVEYDEVSTTNCRVQFIASSRHDDENNKGIKPMIGAEPLKKIIKGNPDFILSLNKEEFLKIRTKFSKSIDPQLTSIQDILEKLSSTAGNVIYQYALHETEVSNPIMLEIDSESIAVPDLFSLYVKKSDLKKQDYRFFKTSGGYIIDTSEIEIQEVEVEFDGVFRTANAKLIRNIDVMIFEDFTTYPAVFIEYNPLQPNAQPPTIEEVSASQVQVLKLPNIILARQMRIPYRGKKVPISAVSLDRWSKSDLSYGGAVEIINDHVSNYTRVDDNGNRTNSGATYEQTRKWVTERLTDKKTGKVKKAQFMETMSKYAFTIEETFFNLNEDFSNPEKLLGYFLGMGISPNNLYMNEVSPYRLLCARLLGIDYALNYFELCKNSVIAGHLFVDDFEDGKPIFCNADVFLDTNYYVTKAKIETETFQNELTEFFGADIAPQVLESHELLLKDYSPKFMKLHHGTKQEYKDAVRNNGVGTPYEDNSQSNKKIIKENRMQEVTRITLALGLTETDGDYQDNNTNMITMIDNEYQKSLNEKYWVDVTRTLRAKYENNLSYLSAMQGESAFSKYAATMDTSLYGKASAKLKYNDLDKNESIRRFYFDPKSARAGAHNLLRLGLSITNKELADDESPRETGVIRIDWRAYDTTKKKTGEPPKLDAKFVEKGLKDYSLNLLEKLGYDIDNPKVIKELARIIATRANGLYHEFSSLARIEGDELYSLAYALAAEEDMHDAMEFLFNLKYNNFALKPFDRIPIFLENNRTFGDIGDYVANTYNPDGSAAGFSLRQAQRDGLRFLGASGNSGLLAHEVGFGKTTSSIAKVSDLFLRGEAKRVLISVPNPVYDSGNWQSEISGLINEDTEERKNGLLPSNITLVNIGTMSKADLLGKKINKGDPEWEEKSEETGYNGAVAYSESDLHLMKVLKGTTEGLKEIVGGAFNKYGKNKDTSMLTPREQKYGLENFEDMWIQQNPFFKKSEEYKKENIVRINDTPRQSIAGLTTTIKSKDYNFWDIGDSQYMEFGRLTDISDGTVDSKDSFIKKVYEELLSKSPDIHWDEEDGGDIKKIISKLQYIHKKYENKYQELSNKNHKLEKRGRGKASIFGGAHPVLKSQVTSFAKKLSNSKYDIDPDSMFDRWSTKNEMTISAGYWIAVKTLEILEGNAKENSAAWFPYYGTRSFWERVVLPWAKKNHKNSPYKSVEQLQRDLEAEFPFMQVIISGEDAITPELESLAKAQIKTALELQMTEEIAYFFVTLSKQAPLFLGKFKEWATRPNSVVLCSHLAIPKLSVAQKFGEESVDFMAGIYGNESPTQYLNGRVPNPSARTVSRLVLSKPSKDAEFAQGVRTRGQTEKLFLSQYRGMDINLLSCDAFMVDEVHNFNRAFNNVRKGSRVARKIGTKSSTHSRPVQAGKVQANIKGALRYPENVYAYDTKANYNIRGEVQNFIALCLYFQDRGRVISRGHKRKVENTIFLSATPFTDDNFQMLSLFGAMSASKLMQGNVFNTFDFFQLYAKELWQKNIDYQNRYTLFPKIVGYKNVYALSQLIKTFTNFKISDKEIEKRRPQKVIVGTTSPRIKGVEDDELNKVISQVPFNEAQKKMNADLSDYIGMDSDSELSYTKADYQKAEEIFDKLQKKGKKGSPAAELVAKLKKDHLLSYSQKKGVWKIDYELEELDEIENLLNEIFDLDPDNAFAKAVRAAVDDTDIEGAEGGEEKQSVSESVDDDEVGAINANAVKNEDDNVSLAQKIAQRALEASRTQQLTLISPYYLTINNDKNLMNPYLPPLDGTPSENAKNVVENSPKLLFACKAIGKVLKYAVNTLNQSYAGAGEAEAIMGQVVYANNYKFRYHGKDFFLFDLMTQYIIDNNKEFLESIVENSGRDVSDLFASIDGRTKGEKTDIVEDFQKGYCLILFGTESIKEGINLQKNCPIMYILQVGFVPVTYMQLHGRVWRQGNPYKYAFLINVLTQNSIDAFVYSKLENKIASVKQMLGSEVYDSEETQFDVDVAEIKINLIADPEKLAEMQWEDDEQEYSRTVDRLTEELKLMTSLGADYPAAKEKYEVNIGYVNTFSENIYKNESYIYGKFYSEKINRQRYDVATQKLVDAQYPAQFPSDKVRDAFELNPDKYKKKDGKSKYESRKDMASSLRKGVKIKTMTLQEGIAEVQENNTSDNVDREFKLSFKRPFKLDPTTPLTEFVAVVQDVFEVAKKTRQRMEKMERDKTLADVITEYFDPALDKVLPTIQEGAKPEEVLKAMGLYGGSRGQFDLHGRYILIIACLKDANPNFIDGKRVDDFAVERMAARFRTGDEAITISAFNQLVSNEQITEGKTSRDATLDDIEIILERKEKEKEKDQYKLDNKEESKDILRKEFAEKLKQRDGISTPSVEDRVNDLEAIFPYLEKK
jgi:hypothetical protein